MYNYFSKLPVITYSNNAVINIAAKVKFADVTKKLGVVFHPYIIEEGQRADSIAHDYYGDARYSWLVYMCNDIIDPFYDWPLSDDSLKEFIAKKYGSIDKAYNKIVYWEDNWYEDESTLSTSAYNALPSYRKKYFKPIVGINNVIVAYDRCPLNLVVETNKTEQLSLSNTSGFSTGDYIKQTTSGTLTGSGEVKFVNSSVVIIQNVLGEFSNTTITVSTLTNNTVSANVTNKITLNQSIPSDELSYWTYKSAYDYEYELNEQKRSIKLVDSSLVSKIEKDMDDLL